MTALIKEGMESGGPPMAFERFIRFVAGDANWEQASTRRPAADAGERRHIFGIESGAFDAYLPDNETLAAIQTPIQVLVSAEASRLWPGRRPARRATRASR